MRLIPPAAACRSMRRSLLPACKIWTTIFDLIWKGVAMSTRFLSVGLTYCVIILFAGCEPAARPPAAPPPAAVESKKEQQKLVLELVAQHREAVIKQLQLLVELKAEKVSMAEYKRRCAEAKSDASFSLMDDGWQPGDAFAGPTPDFRSNVLVLEYWDLEKIETTLGNKERWKLSYPHEQLSWSTDSVPRCANYVTVGPSEDEYSSDVQRTLLRILGVRYVLVVRSTNYVRPEFKGYIESSNENQFISGRDSYHAALFDLSTGKYIGGFPFQGVNSDRLSFKWEKYDRKDEAAAWPTLNKDLIDNTNIAFETELKRFLLKFPTNSASEIER
jgi:hypothetical protein